MIAAVRSQSTGQIARRAFSTSRAQMSSPYHYPSGAGSNLPFNPKSKWFGPGFVLYAVAGFGAPFGISVYQTYRSK
ncbi:hypothetical protein Cpir12675_001788 [Ceratocystis pirilliformis]|uniref:Cytochrome c oxidase subunit 8, mitochondrial n=1 Tax=Ceratocystis pirilliformis TaxID=259994 RepID=A0ABR3ZDC5_9PEZI